MNPGPARDGRRDDDRITGAGNYAAILKQLYNWKWRGVMTVEYEHQSPQLVQDVIQCVRFVEDFAAVRPLHPAELLHSLLLPQP